MNSFGEILYKMPQKGRGAKDRRPPPPLYANVPEESAITVQEPTSWVFLFVYTNNQTEQR